jgi:hypothetical protein
MELTDLERDFLRKLLGGAWISPPMFVPKAIDEGRDR